MPSGRDDVLGTATAINVGEKLENQDPESPRSNLPAIMRSRSLRVLETASPARCLMRVPLAVLGIAFSLLLALAVSGDDAPSVPAPSKSKFLEKPGAFETLVNPNCSHCIDEAKRRAPQLQKAEPVLAWIRGKYDGGAIPVRFFLAPYRVISDTYGVFVYDPDAGYMRGFEASLDFRFHGWRNGILVMRHKDGTLYSALSGKAFDGPRKGDQLNDVKRVV